MWYAIKILLFSTFSKTYMIYVVNYKKLQKSQIIGMYVELNILLLL